MLIEITYNVTDVFMSTTETPVYVEISFEQPGGTSAVWGSITGTLSNQTDLQNALNAKLDESTIDGGTEGQILSKASGTDFDFAWINNYAKYLATNVRNQTGSTIGAFQVVYISGATGNKPLVSLADADTEVTSSKTYGVTATSIANNGTGDVVTAGELSGIDTSAFNEGDLLWLSTTAGGVVTSPPAEPAHAVFIGYVVRSHPTLGTIDVSIQNGYELNELHGVQITTPTDNQGLFYNATSTLWENKSITTALGYTPVPTTRNITINGVTYDLSADRTWTIAAGISGSGAAGQVTYWTGASAVSGSNNLFWDNTNSRLGIGTNAPSKLLSINGEAEASILRGGIVYFRNGTDSNFYITWDPGDFLTYRSFANHRWQTFLSGTADTRMRLYATGNLVLQNGGTFSDGGQRLQVIGDTLLRGSGNTSATTALTVQNSSSTNLFIVRNDGAVAIGSTPSTSFKAVIGGSLQIIDTANTPTRVEINNTTSGSNSFAYIHVESDINSGGADFGKYSTLKTGFKTIAAKDFFVFNNSVGGNITFLNDNANGNVNFAAGGASSPHLTINSNGSVSFGADAMYWDAVTSRLGIGTNAPEFITDIKSAAFPYLQIQSTTDTQSSNGRAGIRLARGSSSTLTGVDFVKNDLDNLEIRRVTVGSATTWLTLFRGTGNLVLQNGGTFTDGGQRLQVIGDTLLRGSGATSATTALTVQNSSSTNLLTVRNDGFTTIGTTTQGLQTVNATISSYLICNSSIGAVFGSYTSFNSKAVLQCDSTTKGFLPPRMTTTQKNAITTPPAGLVVYDTDLNKLCVYTTAWETITSI